VPLVAVQKVLRHEGPKLTEATYGHLEQDFLIDSVDRLRFDGMPEPEPVAAPLLTVLAAAEALGLSRATVYWLIDRGELPHVRLTRNGIRLRPADLAVFVSRRTP
jgi:excisionase family DNA binding protein